MKITLTIIFLSFFTLCFGPEHQVGYITSVEGINYYDPLIKAVVMVESRNGKYLYNDFEGAVGYFQIRKCRIDHYNKLTGSNYTLNDCYNYELSRKVFLYFAKGKSYEKAAKSWNGSGKQTLAYWKLVSNAIK